jgi:hypothetical protein
MEVDLLRIVSLVLAKPSIRCISTSSLKIDLPRSLWRIENDRLFIADYTLPNSHR